MTAEIMARLEAQRAAEAPAGTPAAQPAEAPAPEPALGPGVMPKHIVSMETGIPADALGDGDFESCRQMAQKILAWSRAQGPGYPIVEDKGEIPEILPPVTPASKFEEWARENLELDRIADQALFKRMGW